MSTRRFGAELLFYVTDNRGEKFRHSVQQRSLDALTQIDLVEDHTVVRRARSALQALVREEEEIEGARVCCVAEHKGARKDVASASLHAKITHNRLVNPTSVHESTKHMC